MINIATRSGALDCGGTTPLCLRATGRALSPLYRYLVLAYPWPRRAAACQSGDLSPQSKALQYPLNGYKKAIIM